MIPADDTLITLKEASQMLFGGKVSPESLKEQWRKGNLTLSKIGRSYFSTVADFKGLKARCLVEAPGRASGPTQSETHGQSSMAEAAIAQGSALKRINELKKHFGITSKESTSRPKLKRRYLQT